MVDGTAWIFPTMSILTPLAWLLAWKVSGRVETPATRFRLSRLHLAMALSLALPACFWLFMLLNALTHL